MEALNTAEPDRERRAAAVRYSESHGVFVAVRAGRLAVRSGPAGGQHRLDHHPREIFREPRVGGRPEPHSGSFLARKFFYICTCEYWFQPLRLGDRHRVHGFQLLLDDWRGYAIAWLAVVAVGNLYMSLYGRLRVDIKSEGLEAKVKEQDLAIKAQDRP